MDPELAWNCAPGHMPADNSHGAVTVSAPVRRGAVASGSGVMSDPFYSVFQQSGWKEEPDRA